MSVVAFVADGSVPEGFVAAGFALGPGLFVLASQHVGHLSFNGSPAYSFTGAPGFSPIGVGFSISFRFWCS